jgi:hypothetical protein
MPSERLERYAEIARHSTRKVVAQDKRAAAADSLDERICALVPDLRSGVRPSRPDRGDDALWAAIPLLFWWGFVLIVFGLTR